MYLRLIVPVVVMCAVAASGLAGTYAVTKDRIALQERLAQERALKAVLPDAVTFNEMTDEDALASAAAAAGDIPVEAVFGALDASDEPAGWGVVVRPRGYGGPMRITVGLDRNGKVTGVTVVTHNETPGLGTKVVGAAGAKPPAYLESFGGVDSAQAAAKLDTITGATKSSRGVRNGVEAALLVYDSVLAEGGGSL